MIDFLKSELAKFNIDLVSSLSLDKCEITRPYMLKKNGINHGSVIIFAVPYLSHTIDPKSNISVYAIGRDYHLFFASLFEKLIKALKNKYPDNKFVGFTDHSPINEIDAAAKSGLGIIGKNHLLITEKYSSFVFIGEIITDAIFPSNAVQVKYCIDCGACLSACPVNMDINKCLSSITQKKGELSGEEISLIQKHGCAWGCDICQSICPYTQQAKNSGSIYTKIDFFNLELTPHLTSEKIEQMSQEDFSLRAYSWRGKSTIERNLKILEETEK